MFNFVTNNLLLAMLVIICSAEGNAVKITCPTAAEISAGKMVGTDKFEVATADNAIFRSKVYQPFLTGASCFSSVERTHYAGSDSSNSIKCIYTNITLTLDEKKSQLKDCRIEQEAPPAEQLQSTYYSSSSGYMSVNVYKTLTANPKSITIVCKYQD